MGACKPVRLAVRLAARGDRAAPRQSSIRSFGRRYDFTSGVLKTVLRIGRAATAELHAAGDGPMAQLFDLIYQVDVLSLRVSPQRSRRDPGPDPPARPN